MKPFLEAKPGVPAWLVSFGDMMTLILTFFILLVSLASTQDAGLVAKGVGSFRERLESHGLPGLLSGDRRAAIFDGTRARFGLPPEDDPTRLDAALEASQLELLRAESIDRLKPAREFAIPGIVRFARGSSALDRDAERALDRIAEELRPAAGEVLLVEGHPDAGGAPGSAHDLELAWARACAVRDRLVREHEFLRARIEARVPLGIPGPGSAGTAGARRITPRAR